MTLTVGIDIGGTSVLAMAFDGGGTAVDRSEVLAGTRGGASVVESVLQAWKGLRLHHEVARTGVGVPGRVDPRTGDVRLAVNLGIGDDPYPLGAELSSAFGLRVAVENDVKVAALGVHEELRRQDRAPSSLALLNIGTGIAAGVVIEGNIFRGSHGMAGEIGHVVVDEQGPRCPCGQQGCLEAVAAGPAISRAWLGRVGVLFNAAAEGDLEANSIAKRVSGQIAQAITWLAATFDIEQVYLGGGVTRAGGPFLQAVRQRLLEATENSSLVAQRLDPELVFLAPIEGSLGPRGAAVMADRYEFSSQAEKAISNQTEGAI
jgi:glucokinase